MEEESKEYNVRVIKAILSGLPDSIKAKVEKCSSAKDMWGKLQDIHSKGALTMTSSKEDVGKKEVNLEPIKDYENEKIENEEDLKEKLVSSLEEISSLKEENKELKKKAQYSGHNLDKTRKEIDIVKLQIQERNEELIKVKEELHQNKKRHHEEVMSMTNQLDKVNKRGDTLLSHLNKVTRS